MNLQEMMTTRTINFTIQDLLDLETMERDLGQLRNKRDTYRSEIVRFAVRYVMAHPELLKELAENPV